MPTTQQLEQATEISRQIDDLRGELHQTLSTQPPTLSITGQQIAQHRGRKLTNLKNGLAAAVGEVLTQPMRVREILDALVAGGYKFESKQPLRVLGVRIYKLAGVKKLGNGLFGRA